jgi:hypothetical protein
MLPASGSFLWSNPSVPVATHMPSELGGDLRPINTRRVADSLSLDATALA